MTWLPYAGITRIRFEGFSCEFSVLTHAPSHLELYHRRRRAVKSAPRVHMNRERLQNALIGSIWRIPLLAILAGQSVEKFPHKRVDCECVAPADLNPLFPHSIVLFASPCRREMGFVLN